MSILSGDIKLMASQRMTDTEDGGGRITGKEIVSGEHNSMFPDISDLDRAYGVVNLRKVFLAVQTDDTDTYTYYGANAAVLLPPYDPNVGLALMTTKDHHDTRNNGQPYFRLDKRGWGAGWAGGNVLRFNTKAANFPIWAIRTVLQSVAASESDRFELQLRGNVNR